MSDNLVKRLRWKAGAYAKEAANRIEQLAATVEKLEEKNSRLKLDLLLANDVADAAIEGKKELEAKLAKAMKALDEAMYFIDIDEEDILKQAGMYRIVKSYAELGALIPAEWADALKRVAELTSSEAANGEAKGGKDE